MLQRKITINFSEDLLLPLQDALSEINNKKLSDLVLHTILLNFSCGHDRMLRFVRKMDCVEFKKILDNLPEKYK